MRRPNLLRLCAASSLLLAACGQAAAPAAPSAVSKPASAAPAQQSGTTTLKVGTQVNQGDFGYLPLWIAQRKGYLADEGIELQFNTIQQSASIAALLNHEIDISADTSRSASQGAPLRNFLWYWNTSTFQFSVTPDIQKPEDLIGKAVGIASPGATQDKATRAIIEKALGLDPNKVQYRPLGSPQARIAAMESKQIAGSANNPDVAALLENMGYRTIANSSKVFPVPFSPLGAHQDLFTNRPRVLQSFIKANLRAAKLLHDQPEEAAKIAGGFAQHLSGDTVLRAVQLDLGAMNPNDYLGATAEGLQLDAGLMKDEQGLAAPPAVDSTSNVAPLRAAQKELGLPCTGGWGCDH